jgi:uncharacterized protein DUF1353
MATLSRRAVLKLTLLSPLTLLIGRAIAAEVTTPGAPYADPDAADRWISEWQSTSRPVAGSLVLTRFADPFYIVTKPIAWTPNPPQQAVYPAVTVPVGFVTDFASIPRVFWSALRPDGDYGYAAIIHDYLYWEQPVTRAMADDILRFAMEDFRVASATATVIHRAVQVGAGSAWANNARLRTAGEKRLLKRFPDDPTMRWGDWKKRSDVF